MATSPIHTTWPLHGRDAELALITAAVGGDGGGVVVAGVAGVGKTRLTRDWADAHLGEDQRIDVSGSTAAAELPFAAVAHILGATPPERLGTDILAAAIEAVRRRADASPQPLVLVVDDLHDLDPGSALLVSHVVRQRLASLLGTTRTGEEVADSIRGLWRDDLVRRLELQPLAEAEVGELTAQVLGAPLDRPSTRQLWGRTRGNPLYLREVVRAAVGSGALHQVGERWRWSGSIEVDGELAALVAERFAALSSEARQALCVVAFGEPVEIDVVAQITGSDALEELESQALIEHVVDSTRADHPGAALGRRRQVRCAHPLYADVVRATTGSRQADAVRMAIAQAIERRGSRRVDDTLRVAAARLSAGSPPDPDRCVEAAWTAWARADAALTESLARAALASGPHPEATYVLGEALASAGRYADAEDVWATLSGLDEPESLVARVAQSRAPVLAFSLGRPEDARAALDRAVALVADPALLALLESTRNVVFSNELAVDGDARPMIELPAGADDEAATWTWIANAQAQLLEGRFAAVIAASAHIDTFVATATATWPLAALFVGVCRFLSLAHGGRLAEADRLAAGSLDAALSSSEPLARTMWTEAIGYAALLAGDAASATTQFSEAIALLRSNDPGTLGFTLVEQATARALLGDTSGARAALDEADALPASFMLPPLARERAEAALVATEGHVSRGRDLLRAHAESARAANQPYFEVPALHDLVRLGGADATVARRLAELARTTMNPVAELYAAQADAAVRRDAAALERLAARFADHGLMLDAAETAAMAARGHEAEGEVSAATRSWRLVADHRRSCPGVTTAALTHVAAPTALTARELEIALLASRGATNAELAGQLSLSVRTVHAHLRSIFSKLGVNRREDLAAAMGADPAI